MPRKGQKKQAVTTGPAKHYGDTARSVMQQKTIPLPAAPGPPPASAAPAPAAAAPGPGAPPDPHANPFPGSAPLTPLTAPTQLPGQPVTHGAAFGPGAGPEALGTDDGTGMVQAQMRALFRAYPLSELADLMAEAQTGR